MNVLMNLLGDECSNVPLEEMYELLHLLFINFNAKIYQLIKSIILVFFHNFKKLLLYVKVLPTTIFLRFQILTEVTKLLHFS